MSESFVPKTRLEKILCGVAATAKTRLEKAVKNALTAVDVTGSAGEGSFSSSITAAELYSIVCANKSVRFVGEGFTFVASVNAMSVVEEDVASYSFVMLNNEGDVYVTDVLDAEDNVVFTAKGG